MALFGKKAKDSASVPPPADLANGENGSGDVAVIDAPVTLTKGKTARAPKAAPKAPKNKAVKNGVAVGLNIGNQFIKAVEVSSKNGELTVTAMGAVPTPPESYTNGNVLSVSALAGAIRDLWKAAGIKSKVAITSVAGTGALVVRVIEVPKMSDGELGDNMKVDADRYIPFPPSEVVMDFKALRELPSDPDAPNMEVLLAAAQREIIDLHVQVVQKARLDPRAIDVEPIAAARAMQLERRGDGNSFIDYNEVTAIVNLGATGTEISILRGDILVFTRVVPGGGNALTQAIADGMGLTLSDAERVKIESADAIAPAGYTEGGDFGGGGDFNFGDDFSGGGDLNSAFDDISANPTPASDDPFDLDFFNQPSQDEPGTSHAQKEGEPGENPASGFDFSGFNFDEPVADAPTVDAPPAKAPVAEVPVRPAPETPATSPAPVADARFDFGFDDLSDSVLPSVAEGAPAVSGSDKGTARLEATTSGAAPTPAPSMADFAAPTGSAFDFDNFDLPAAAEVGQPTVSIPIEPSPTAQTVVTSADPGFDFNAPPVAAASETGPISFDFEDDALASKNASVSGASVSASPLASPLSFEKAPPSGAEPQMVAPSTPEAAFTGFDFALGDPAPATPQTPGVTIQPEETLLETALPVAAVSASPAAVSASPNVASQSDEFDLDAIFGGPAVASEPTALDAGTPVALSSPLASPEQALDFEEFGAPSSATALPVAASSGVDDFDLSGIDTGAGDDFGAGFGDSADFTDFGAGLGGAGGAAADAAALYGLIHPPLEELASEVRRSLEFHLGRYPDATISRLVLLGGGARLRNLDVFLMQMIGVPTAVANPFANITVHTPKLAPGYSSDNGPLCAVALGLALRDFLD